MCMPVFIEPFTQLAHRQGKRKLNVCGKNNNLELDSILQKCKALPFPLISLKMLSMDFQQKMTLNIFNCWFCFMSLGWWRTITTTLSEHYKTLYQMNNFWEILTNIPKHLRNTWVERVQPYRLEPEFDSYDPKRRWMLLWMTKMKQRRC